MKSARSALEIRFGGGFGGEDGDADLGGGGEGASNSFTSSRAFMSGVAKTMGGCEESDGALCGAGGKVGAGRREVSDRATEN